MSVVGIKPQNTAKPHDILLALVRLLARQAASEAFKASAGSAPLRQPETGVEPKK